MNKTLLGLATSVALLVSSPAFADVTVDVNGQPVSFDQPPIMQGGRVLVPLRGVFERLGAGVTYNGVTRTIVAQSGSNSVTLQLGSTMAMVNGQQQTLDAPPMVVGSRVLVPLRFVSQALGAAVNWDAASQQVAITGGLPPQASLPPSESYPAPAAPTIAQIQLDDGRLPQRPLRPGDVLTVTTYGTANCTASFDISGQSGFAMQEGPSGTYTGEYTVRRSDLPNNAVVTVHLTAPDGLASTRNADQLVAMGGEPIMHPMRLIRSVVHNGIGTLAAGQILQVTMLGASGGLGTFDVGGHLGLPMQEVSEGTYIGTFSVPFGEVNPNAQIVAHLTMPDGATTALIAPPSVSLIGIPR